MNYHTALRARIAEINEASTLLQRNIGKSEYAAMESNLRHIIAKAEAAITKLHAAQQAGIDEMDAKP